MLWGGREPQDQHHGAPQGCWTLGRAASPACEAQWDRCSKEARRTRWLMGLSATPPLDRLSRSAEGTTLSPSHTGTLQVPRTQTHGQTRRPVPVPAGSWGHGGLFPGFPTAGCWIAASPTSQLPAFR